MARALELDNFIEQRDNSHDSLHRLRERVGQIPRGWQLLKLRDVLKEDRSMIEPQSFPERKFWVVTMDCIESNSGRLMRRVELEGKRIKSMKYRFDSNHILYGKLRPYLNKVFVPTEGEGVCTTEFIPFRVMGAQREYVAHYLRTKRVVNFAMSNITGTRQPRANMDAFLECPVPIPPLEEQKRVADKIDRVLAKVGDAKILRGEAITDIETVMQAAIREVLSNATKNGWKEVGLGEIVELLTSGATPTVSDEDLYADERDGVPFFRIQNVAENRLLLSDVKYITQDVHTSLLKRSQVRPKDVLLTITGRLGTAACVPDSVKAANINQHICLIRPKQDRADPKYIAYHLNSKVSFDEMMRKQAGATRIALNHKTIGSLAIRLPSLNEQQEIVGYLEKLQARIEAVQNYQYKTQTEVGAISESLLEHAFQGAL